MNPEWSDAIRHAAMSALVGLAVVATIPASPAMAKTTRPVPIYANTVVMQFTGPNGQTRTFTEHVYMDAGHDCSSFSGETVERYKHPELAGMKLTSETCHDTSGGARPGGPAIVVLRFVTADRQLKTAVVEHQGSTDFDMKTCPSVLHATQASLVAQVQGQFPGGKFVEAECMARPKYVASFLKNNN